MRCASRRRWWRWAHTCRGCANGCWPPGCGWSGAASTGWRRPWSRRRWWSTRPGWPPARCAATPTCCPARGQIVLVANTGIYTSVRDEGDPSTYVHPRSRDVVLGGTWQEGDWNTTPDPATRDAILERCRALVPELAGAPVLGEKVGPAAGAARRAAGGGGEVAGRDGGARVRARRRRHDARAGAAPTRSPHWPSDDGLLPSVHRWSRLGSPDGIDLDLCTTA